MQFFKKTYSNKKHAQFSNLATRAILNSNSFSSSYGTFESGFTHIVYTHEFAVLNVRFQPTREVPTWSTIFTIPGGIKPGINLTVKGGEGYYNNTIRITTAGAIIVENTVSNGQALEFNACFFINWN